MFAGSWLILPQTSNPLLKTHTHDQLLRWKYWKLHDCVVDKEETLGDLCVPGDMGMKENKTWEVKWNVIFYQSQKFGAASCKVPFYLFHTPKRTSTEKSHYYDSCHCQSTSCPLIFFQLYRFKCLVCMSNCLWIVIHTYLLYLASYFTYIGFLFYCLGARFWCFIWTISGKQGQLLRQPSVAAMHMLI